MSRTTRLITLTLALVLIASVAARANLGTVTAGAINGVSVSATTISGGTISGTAISGGTISGAEIYITTGGNRIWLNDSADGAIHVGGTNKATSPFRVNADGELQTELADVGTLAVDDQIVLFFTTTGAGNRYLCVNSTGVVFDSGTPCN